MSYSFKINKIIFNIILLILILIMHGAIASIVIPKPVGYVNDYADVISQPQETKIESIIQELKIKTGSEIVVVTLKSLNGYPIEDYGLQIGRQWKIGQTGKDNGLIILVAPNDRKFRIEVGYGLEGIITDARAGRIRDNYMLPYFKQGKYEEGIIQGTAAIVKKISIAESVTIDGNYVINEPVQTSSSISFFHFIFFVIFIILVIKNPNEAFLLLMLFSDRGGGSYRGNSSGGFGGFSGGGGFGGGGASGGW